MSRLDDELRNAFRREEPPAGFTARVLERVARQPARKPRWFQRLATLLYPPKLRWVAIGVTASLLLAIGAAQYSTLRKGVVKDDVNVAEAPPSEEGKSSVSGSSNTVQRDVKSETPNPASDVRRGTTPSTKHQFALSRLRKEQQLKKQELRAEAKAAKEKLMLALYIASATLNDAQRAVHDDSPKP